MELAFGGFDGLFDGTALGEFGGGYVAYQAGMHGAVFAGGQDGSQHLIQLVVGRRRVGVHCGWGDWIAGGRERGGAGRLLRNCYETG